VNVGKKQGRVALILNKPRQQFERCLQLLLCSIDIAQRSGRSLRSHLIIRRIQSPLRFSLISRLSWPFPASISAFNSVSVRSGFFTCAPIFLSWLSGFLVIGVSCQVFHVRWTLVKRFSHSNCQVT
jgi:hypothetical protein